MQYIKLEVFKSILRGGIKMPMCESGSVDLYGFPGISTHI